MAVKLNSCYAHRARRRADSLTRKQNACNSPGWQMPICKQNWRRCILAVDRQHSRLAPASNSMFPPEPESFSRILERSRLRYSLRSLFGLSFAIAAFFSLGRTLGYVDAAVILIGVAFTTFVIVCPPRIHLLTAVLVVLFAGALLWVNLRPINWTKEFGIRPPDSLDSVARSMFDRGWPVSPSMFCAVVNLSTTTESETEVYATLVVDCLVFVSALCIIRFAVELGFWLIRAVRSRARSPTVDIPSDCG
jgi:hypothetical protein